MYLYWNAKYQIKKHLNPIQFVQELLAFDCCLRNVTEYSTIAIEKFGCKKILATENVGYKNE